MKVVTLSEAISLIHSGDKVGISGFLGVGEPLELIEELVRQNQQDLTLVSVVTSQPGKEVGVGRLCENHPGYKVHCSPCRDIRCCSA